MPERIINKTRRETRLKIQIGRIRPFKVKIKKVKQETGIDGAVRNVKIENATDAKVLNENAVKFQRENDLNTFNLHNDVLAVSPTTLSD